MNKYIILIILNTPLALYGLFNSLLLYKLKKLRPKQAVLHSLFWAVVLLGIAFVKPLTDFLHAQDLTDSPPLSIFDVLLVTGIIISLLLVSRAHTRQTELENRFTALHEKLSILLSDNNRKT